MEKDAKTRFFWSRERDFTFKTCLRQYFFRYYAGLSPQTGGPRDKEIAILHRLNHRQDWANEQVQRIIRAVLESGNPPPAADILVQELLTAMRADFRDSRNGLYRQAGNASKGLFEHEYQLKVPDHIWKENADRAEDAVRRFLESETLKWILALPPEARLESPKGVEFILDGLPVRVRPGFAFRRDDRIELVHWRMESPLQLDDIESAGRVLYAASKWNVSLEKIQLVDVELSTGEEHRHAVDEDALNFAKEYIHDSADEMQFPLDDPETNTAAEDNFDTTEDDAPCRRCPYLKVCPKWT
ncbi:MAG TPA: hypothetical protein DCZ95_01635 [Verrucomicrobia bacterium]|nr:MAG: hypothetical protein A2X46_08630 [Lentisphaerae bacterium GWF2_57_35]HBA82771.1 hypothetical protein [Verrucomicrobiota bacterium]